MTVTGSNPTVMEGFGARFVNNVWLVDHTISS